MRYHKSWPSIVCKNNRLLGRRQRDHTNTNEDEGIHCSELLSNSPAETVALGYGVCIIFKSSAQRLSCPSKSRMGS